jgi:hypothetical protein
MRDNGDFNGADGKDGVSVSHSWEGTILTITSASGTSSANLKGEKGNPGEKGDKPVKGEDYFTPEEIETLFAFDGVYNPETNKAATVETVAREVARIISGAPEDFDTLKELSDWLATHGTEATEMNSAIKANAEEIKGIKADQTEQNTAISGAIDTANEAKQTANTLDGTIQTALNHSVETRNLLSQETQRAQAAEQANASKITEQNGKIEQNTQRAVTAQGTADNALTVANSGVTLATTALSISEEARSNSNSAVATASEANEISKEANAKADGLAESKQDNLAFDGEYNAVSNKVATVNTVASKVAEIVSSAPEDFDTLKEVADYIASDKTGAAEINNKLSEHGTQIAENTTAIAERVKYTDYATSDKGGVVKVNQTYGTRVVNGVLDLMPAQNSLIDSRTPNDYPLYLVNNLTRHMIVPANIDYAVKKALADCKINDTTYAWTDEEKASARELLGIDALIGDIGTVLDEIHAYAQSLVNGGNA